MSHKFVNDEDNQKVIKRNCPTRMKKGIGEEEERSRQFDVGRTCEPWG